MAPASKPSDSDVALRAAIGDDLRPLKSNQPPSLPLSSRMNEPSLQMAAKVDLREAKDDICRNALHLAALKGHLEVCKFLVEELGLDVNSTMVSNAKSPVHFAAAGGNKRVLGYLLDHGGDAGVPDSKGSTPLHDAAEQGHCEAIRLLLSKGVDVDRVNYRGTPLHLAASMGKDQALKILLEHGADPNKVVNHVFSPLMVACCEHSLKCVKLLVEYGKIPIMDAAVNGQRELVEILFPVTRPIPSVPDWSVDGIIRGIKHLHFEAQDAALVGEQIADAKSQGKEAFAKGEYISAIFFYSRAMEKDPFNATLLANRSLCWLRQGERDRALLDAQQCTTLCPHWSKAWYREGAALSSLKDYKGAVDAFMRALKLDPASDEIRKALRQMLFVPFYFWETIDATKSDAARTKQGDS
nr:unnamed protein product [Digitaria exilis]